MNKKTIRHFLGILAFILSLSVGYVSTVKSAQAFGGHRCSCGRSYCCDISCAHRVAPCSQACACKSDEETAKTIPHITSEFIVHRRWIISVFWETNILPALMLMTEQMTTVAIQQTLGIGMLFDAKHQLESQRLLQELQAQAHKDYQPSESLCTFGTNVRSLAASERNAQLTQIALADRAMERILITGTTASSGTSSTDSESRWVQFRQVYCNPNDNANGFANLCTNNLVERFNKDVNFTHTIEKPQTLEIDFTTDADGDHTPRGATADEEDVMALMANLYGSRLFPEIPDFEFMTDPNGNPIDEGSFLYMDIRSLAAKRNVALSSLAAIAGLKSQGEDAVQPYMQALYEEMGINMADAQEILGPRPSYDAQMKFLTQTLYHHNFFADLYDKPVNVDRKEVAMQAVGLMQKRDMYKSLLRSEMLKSVWLETALKDLEEKYVNEELPGGEGRLIREIEGVLP